jgi:hypothetical protein
MIFFTIILLTPIIFFNNVVAQDGDGITVDPSSLDIVVAEDYTGKINRTVQIVNSSPNVSKIEIFSTDLLERGNEKLISASNIAIDSSTKIPVPGGTMLNVVLTISPDRLEPGIYSGKLLVFTGLSGDPMTVPIKLSIHSAAYFAMILIAAGVISNFLLQLAKWKTSERQSTEEAISAAEDLSFQLIDLGKAKGNKYDEGKNLLNDAIQSFKDGKYTEAKKSAERAKNLFNIVLTSPDQRPDERITSGKSADSYTEKRERFGFQVSPLVTISSILYDFLRTNFIVYGGVTVVLAVALLQLWQQFFPQLSTFGASGIDYVAAFLVGYAGESLLSEAVDFAKKI